MKENRQSNLVILFTVILFSILIGSSCSSQKDISHSKEIELLRLDSIEYKKPVISTCGYFLP